MSWSCSRLRRMSWLKCKLAEAMAFDSSSCQKVSPQIALHISFLCLCHIVCVELMVVFELYLCLILDVDGVCVLWDCAPMLSSG